MIPPSSAVPMFPPPTMTSSTDMAANGTARCPGRRHRIRHPRGPTDPDTNHGCHDIGERETVEYVRPIEYVVRG
jgi:hypothetical protein